MANTMKELFRALAEQIKVETDKKFSTKGELSNVSKTVDENKNEISNIKDAIGDYYEDLKFNHIINSVDGNEITLSDSANHNVKGFELYGKSEQLQTTGKNLFDQNTIKYKKFITSNGIDDSDSYNISDYIRVLPLSSITLSSASNISNNWMAIGEFDENKKYIKRTTDNVYKQHSLSVNTSGQTSYIAIGFSGLQPTPLSIQVELGSTATEYEPYTGGKPSPSPEYPQEIKSVENTVVSVSGKNLLPYPYLSQSSTIGGITFTVFPDGKVKAVGTSTKIVYFDLTNKFIPNNYFGNKLYIGFNGASNKNIFPRASLKDRVSIIDYSLNKANNINNNETEMYLAIRFDNGTTVNGIFEPMILDESESDSSYEPYKEPQTVTISQTLRAIPVSSGGNVTIDGQQYIADVLKVNADGSGSIERRIGKTIGSELNITRVTTSVSNKYRYRTTQLSNIIKKPTDNAIVANILSSKAKVVTASNTWKTDAEGIAVESNGNIQVYLNDYATKTLDDFKAMFNDAVIVYELEIPSTEQLSKEQVDAILALNTFKPTTVITNDQNAMMGVTYIADVKNYIDNKINELATAIVASKGE